MPTVRPSDVVRYLEDSFKAVKKGRKDRGRFELSGNYAPELRTVAALLHQMADYAALLDVEAFIRVVEAKAAIDHMLEIWATGDPRGPLKGHFLVELRDALAACPDEIPAPGSQELSFMSEPDDEALRSTLRLDISSAQRALRQGDWKWATVLAASVVEALILWAINKVPAPSVAGLSTKVQADYAKRMTMTFGPLVQLAFDLRLITDSTRKVVERAAEYRNLIHPGKAQRTGAECHRGTAHVAFGCIDVVVEDIKAA